MRACRNTSTVAGLLLIVACGAGTVAHMRDRPTAGPAVAMGNPGARVAGTPQSRVASATYAVSYDPTWTTNFGVVVDSAVSYSPDHLFADAIKSAREFASYGSLNTPVAVDSDGWPKEDASLLVWEGGAGAYVSGKYRFSCDGQVTGNNVTAAGASLSGWGRREGVRTIGRFVRNSCSLDAIAGISKA